MTPEERFWTGIDRRGPEECWPHIGCDQSPWEGRTQSKRRIVWLVTNGAIPPKFLVLAKCGNSSCCNPAHLFLGGKKARAQNTKRLGRSTAGIKNTHAKLTEDQVLEIISLRGKLTQREIAKRFGMSQASVGHIMIGTTWKHLQSKCST